MDGVMKQEVENMLVAEYDYETDIAVQREEAAREGKAEGKAETAQALKNMGVSAEIISKATGFSPSEIASW